MNYGSNPDKGQCPAFIQGGEQRDAGYMMVFALVDYNPARHGMTAGAER